MALGASGGTVPARRCSSRSDDAADACAARQPWPRLVPARHLAPHGRGAGRRRGSARRARPTAGARRAGVLRTQSCSGSCSTAARRRRRTRDRRSAAPRMGGRRRAARAHRPQRRRVLVGGGALRRLAVRARRDRARPARGRGADRLRRARAGRRERLRARPRPPAAARPRALPAPCCSTGGTGCAPRSACRRARSRRRWCIRARCSRRRSAIGRRRSILVHNHPSGDPTPSAEDVALTRAAAPGGRGRRHPRARPRGGRARALRQPGRGAALVTAPVRQNGMSSSSASARGRSSRPPPLPPPPPDAPRPRRRRGRRRQELHALRDHLGDVALLAFLVVVLAACGSSPR